ncbi:solute carrier family 26 member 10 isoform X4 [Anoplophora glabripennis]|uniref:solute carrier family 26 member 10 isoform X4 n=1 Tax=Anoplophora glabripennis TaxID=217634 RepID=UPI000874B85C|nr:solute carrier family 26 member 10 isoform X4 [Anoplophora glabripennis]
MEEELTSQIRIERPLYEHDQLRQDFYYEKPKKSFLKNQCKREELNIKNVILRTIPIMQWMPHYRWKTSFLSDVISGFTVAVMHIPQGMAYALLGNVPPVVGIYMAFFPVLVYLFFGTSRHNSMGTFAVACLMTGKAVLEYSDPYYFQTESNSNITVDSITEVTIIKYSPIEVATAVTITVAIFQLAMYILQLGAVSALLSETLVSGFTTGAAIHVLSSQIKDLLGLKIPRFKGYFTVFYTLKAVTSEISNFNFAALTISAITIIVTTLNNELLKPIVAKKSSFPVPIELIAVILGTLISRYCQLPELYNITTVGEIPQGLPSPTIPPISLIPTVLLDGFTIAIVTFTITLSMAFIFAQKLNYEVDANQELFAMGTGNIVGSFFSCMPVCASLSRSLIQQVVGGKTQIASLISCGILVIILLWIGPFFEPLPKTKQIDGIKIFHYCGGINFATRNIFKKDIMCLVEINPQKEIIYRSKLAEYINRDEDVDGKSKANKEKILKLQKKINTHLRCLIMDFSSVSYIDPSGVSMLKNVIESFQKLDIPVYIAACSDPVYNMMKKCNLICITNPSLRLFPTIQDAVQCSSDLFKFSLNSNISSIRV